jgi:negative regulator of sigma E activity
MQKVPLIEEREKYKASYVQWTMDAVEVMLSRHTNSQNKGKENVATLSSMEQ